MEVVSRWAKTLASKRGFPSAPARGQGDVCLYSSVFIGFPTGNIDKLQIPNPGIRKRKNHRPANPNSKLEKRIDRKGTQSERIQ